MKNLSITIAIFFIASCSKYSYTKKIEQNVIPYSVDTMSNEYTFYLLTANDINYDNYGQIVNNTPNVSFTVNLDKSYIKDIEPINIFDTYFTGDTILDTLEASKNIYKLRYVEEIINRWPNPGDYQYSQYGLLNVTIKITTKSRLPSNLIPTLSRKVIMN